MIWKLLSLLALVCLVAGGLYSASTIEQYRQANAGLAARVAELEALPDPQEQYYRGMYDTWAWVGKTTGYNLDLLTFVSKAVDKDWYGQPSTGWQWPIEAE